MDFASFHLSDKMGFKSQVITWANSFPIFCFLDSNDVEDKYGQYDYIIGIDSIHDWKELTTLPRDKFHFGYIAYDNLSSIIHSNHKAFINFDSCFFFEPRYIIYVKDNRVFINRNAMEAIEVLSIIQNTTISLNAPSPIQFTHRTNKETYLENISTIQNAIREGKFYELNYCIEFYNEAADIDPISTFILLNQKAKSPMSALVKQGDKWIISLSPERLACLRGHKLISQPIKGTARRDLQNNEHDLAIKTELSNSPKERAENTMIVDLVRHDMTPYAHTSSIKVEEWAQVYTFPFVHQMISTITAQLKDSSNSRKALQQLLPAGSMTGAPKKEVMQFIQHIENFHRGVYAGNIGYFDHQGDFDFNVVIRSLYYDNENKKISLSVGGAITLLSNPEIEYNECMLKAEGILQFFSDSN